MDDHLFNQTSSLEELKQRMQALLALIEEPKDLPFIYAAFSESERGNVCQALVELCLQGDITIDPTGIRHTDQHRPAGRPSRSETPIKELGLRPPIMQRLKDAGIDTIEQLLQKSRDDLLAIQGMGAKKATEVMEALDRWRSMRSRFEAGRCPTIDPPRMKLDDWIESLPDKQRKVVTKRLDGKRLQFVADALGLTRERVRQIEKKAFASRPPLEEDSYADLFLGYEFEEKSFCNATDEPARVFRYLKTAFKEPLKDIERKPLSDLVEDEEVPATIKDAVIRGGVDEGCVYEDGIRIETNKEAIVEHLLTSMDERVITSEELMTRYSSFIREHGLEGIKTLLPTSQRAFDACLQRYPNMLSVPSANSQEGRVVRWFDSSVDLEPLKDALLSHSQDDIECSTESLMKEPDISEAVEPLHLRDGYELHIVIGKYLAPLEGIQLGRLPMIKLGSGDRDRQILTLIKETSPISPQNLAQEYERRYGMRADTFRGSCLRGFETFFSDGLYRYACCSLDEKAARFVTEFIDDNGGYASISSLQEALAKARPDLPPHILNAETLTEVDLRISGELVAAASADLGSAFSHLIQNSSFFDDSTPGFSPEVLANGEFRAELNKALRRFQVVEYAPHAYMNSAVLEDLATGCSSEDIADYMNAAIEFMQPSVPYSIKSLIRAGFSHKLMAAGEELSLDHRFYEGVIMQGYVGGRIKRTSIGSTFLFCKKTGWFSSVDVLRDAINPNETIVTKDLKARLLDLHGIELGAPVLRNLVKRAELAYDPATDTVSFLR